MTKKKSVRVYPWRNIEAIAHQIANRQPNTAWDVWLENHETEYSERLTIRSSAKSLLSELSIRDLRDAKVLVDGDEDFDGARVYSLEVLEEVRGGVR
jgi:hypothetical protein